MYQNSQKSQKSYYNTTQITSSKIYYSVYIIDGDITKINKMIIDEKPIDCITKAVDCLLKKPYVKCYLYTDPNLQALLQYLDEYNRIIMLTEENENLQNYIEELKEHCPQTSMSGFELPSFETNQNVKIKCEYFEYICRYGPPPDGIFNPSLLLLITNGY